MPAFKDQLQSFESVVTAQEDLIEPLTPSNKLQHALQLYYTDEKTTSPSSNGDKISLRGVNSDSPTLNDNSARPPVAITANLLILAAACSLGFFSFGYQITVLNAPGSILEAWMNESYAKRGLMQQAADNNNGTGGDDNVPGVAPSTTRLLYAITTGALSAGGIFGSTFAGIIADRIGRRGGQLVSAALALIAAPMCGASGHAYAPEMLMFGRVLFGLSAGAATALSPMYLIESSPQSVRGSMSTLTQLAAVIGVFLSQVLGLPPFLGTARLWPMLFWFAAAAPALQLFLVLMSPESPRYLYIARGDKLGAIKALKILRPRDADLSDELADFECEAKAVRQIQKVKLRELFTHRQYLWPLSVAIVMQLSQQWSGINGILGYSSILFEEAGLSPASASYANLSIGVISIVTAIALTVLIDRLGRRVLHLGGMAGMIVFGLLITLFSLLPRIYNDVPTVQFANVANIACVLVFLTFFSLGPASIPWIISGELFGQEARGPATSVCCFVNWTNSLILFVGFPLLQATLGEYVFMPFVMLLILFLVFLWKFLPETKGRSFEQISAVFERY